MTRKIGDDWWRIVLTNCYKTMKEEILRMIREISPELNEEEVQEIANSLYMLSVLTYKILSQ